MRRVEALSLGMMRTAAFIVDDPALVDRYLEGASHMKKQPDISDRRQINKLSRVKLEERVKKLTADLQEEQRIHVRDLRESVQEISKLETRVSDQARELLNAQTRSLNLDNEAQGLRAREHDYRHTIEQGRVIIADLQAKRESDARLIAALYITLQASMERKP